MAVKITAINHYLPKKLRSSQEIEDLLIQKNPHIKFSKGLIQKITGIKSRSLASENEYSSTMAIKAGKKLFLGNNIDPETIDLLIFASATQDLIEPATCHIIQAELGTQAHCFDIKNACNSFINALEIASSLLENDVYKKALVVVGEKPSVSFKEKLQDKIDFKNSFAGYTFGDGGASVILEKTQDELGIYYQKSVSMSKFWSVGTLPGGGTRNPRGDQHTYFHGGGIELKNAFAKIGKSFIENCLKDMKLGYNHFKKIFIHQVSLPFLEEFINELEIPKTKVEITVVEYGNLASASLPVGMSICIQNQSLKKGDNVLLIGLAGGISLAVTALKI